mgnify:CR=1 FL=1
MRKRSGWSVAILLLCATVSVRSCSDCCHAADAPAAATGPVGPRLQATSVNIKATTGYGGAQGSGTVVLRKVENVDTAFVVTAAHVIDGLRSVQETIVAGDKKQHVTYRDAQIVQEVATTDGSRTVGDTRLDARVLCVDYSRDIAVLRVRAQATLKSSAEFYKGQEIPQAGTEILHCGSPGGQDTGGTATLTSGIISRTGVRIPDFGGSDNGVFDQTDTAALGGSSGGMVCLRSTGEWIGMITLGLGGGGGDSFHWFVPVRAVREFCDKAKCAWLLDAGVAMTEKDLEAIPVELAPPIKGGSTAPPHGATRMLLEEPPSPVLDRVLRDHGGPK